MIQIHDVDGAGEVSLGYVPDPLARTTTHGPAYQTDKVTSRGRPRVSAIADHDFLLRPAPATPPSFGVHTEPEVFGGLNRPDVAGRVFVADRPSFLVGSSLGEDTTEFGFPSVSRLALDLAHSALPFRLHHRYPSAVHLDVDHGRLRGTNLRQVQFLGAADLLLLTRGNMLTDGFGLTLHRLRGDLQAGQQVQLLPALFEAGFAAHHGHHAAHPGRKLGAFHVEFAIPRALPLAALRTDIIGALKLHRPQHGKQLLRTRIVIMSLLTTNANNLFEVVPAAGQQTRQYGCTGPVQ